MATNLKCPNCGAAAVAKEGGACVCPSCGGTFSFQEGEAKLASIGEYDKLKGKVDKIEAHQAELDELLGRQQKPDEIPPEDPPEDPAGDDLDEEDEDDEEEDW